MEKKIPTINIPDGADVDKYIVGNFDTRTWQPVIKQMLPADNPEMVNDVTPKILLDSIIGARIEEIYKLIAEEIEKSGFSANVPSGLVITGGGAHTIGMIEMGRKVVGLPIRVGYPTGVSGLVDEVLDPQYATNVGLILSGGKNIIDHESSMLKFNKIFKDLSIGSSVSKLKDLMKQFIP